MSLGRFPTPLQSSNVPLFSAIDDEYLGPNFQDCKQPESKFSRVAFATSHCKLGEILTQIHLELYGQASTSKPRTTLKEIPCDTSKILDSVMALEDSLNRFEQDLPPPLKCQDSSSTGVLATKPLMSQSLILHAKSAYAPCKFIASVVS